MTRLIRAEALRLASTRTYWLPAARMMSLAASSRVRRVWSRRRE